VSPSFGIFGPIRGPIGLCHVEVCTIHIVMWQGDKKSVHLHGSVMWQLVQ
jgi:hypothetical protein